MCAISLFGPRTPHKLPPGLGRSSELHLQKPETAVILSATRKLSHFMLGDLVVRG